MQRLAALVVATAMLLSGCASKSVVTQARTVDALCELLFPDAGLEINRLLAAFGEPDAIDVEYIPNQHVAGVVDEVHTARFEDGEVVIYSAMAVDKNYLLGIMLTASFWPDSIPVLIGESRAGIRNSLGSPQESTADSYRYYCGEEGSHIAVEFERNRAFTLRLNGWVD